MSGKSGTLAGLGETGLLRKIYGSFGAEGNGAKRRERDGAFGSVLLGPGDDAAVLRAGPGTTLLLSKDDLVEGTHFERRWAEPGKLAARLLAVNLSDLAAMGGATPLGCLVSAGFPPALPARWVLDFLAGLKRASRRRSVPVLGGNLARSGKIFLSMTILGRAGSPLVLRRGARAGELLAGLGPLGEAAAGLALLRGGRVPRWGRALARSFWEPPALLASARRLAPLATSMMDNSDGLLSTARTLAQSSGVRLRLELGGAEASGALRRYCRERRADLRALQSAGGEDYGLVFTLPPRRWEEARKRVSGLYPLGRVLRGRGVEWAGADGALPFEHFR